MNVNGIEDEKRKKPNRYDEEYWATPADPFISSYDGRAKAVGWNDPDDEQEEPESGSEETPDYEEKAPEYPEDWVLPSFRENGIEEEEREGNKGDWDSDELDAPEIVGELVDDIDMWKPPDAEAIIQEEEDGEEQEGEVFVEVVQSVKWIERIVLGSGGEEDDKMDSGDEGGGGERIEHQESNGLDRKKGEWDSEGSWDGGEKDRGDELWDDPVDEPSEGQMDETLDYPLGELTENSLGKTVHENPSITAINCEYCGLSFEIAEESTNLRYVICPRCIMPTSR